MISAGDPYRLRSFRPLLRQLFSEADDVGEETLVEPPITDGTSGSRQAIGLCSRHFAEAVHRPRRPSNELGAIKPIHLQLRVMPGFTKDAIRDWARLSVAPGSHVLSDGLASFNGVVDAGCVHSPTVTGGGRPKDSAVPVGEYRPRQRQGRRHRHLPLAR